jgi:hypothetical protein
MSTRLNVLLVGGAGAGQRRKLEGASVDVVTHESTATRTMQRQRYRFETLHIADGKPPLVLGVLEGMTTRDALDALCLAYEEKHHEPRRR